MDPITAMAVATSAFSAIKKGFAAAKDVESMAGDLSRWMGAVQSVKDGHQKAKSRRIGTVDEEALETWAHQKKIKRMEEELRLFVIGHYGPDAWQDIIRLQGQIRKQRIAEAKQRAERAEELIMWVMIVLLVLIVFGFLYFGFTQIMR